MSGRGRAGAQLLVLPAHRRGAALLQRGELGALGAAGEERSLCLPALATIHAHARTTAPVPLPAYTLMTRESFCILFSSRSPDLMLAWYWEFLASGRLVSMMPATLSITALRRPAEMKRDTSLFCGCVHVRESGGVGEWGTMSRGRGARTQGRRAPPTTRLRSPGPTTSAPPPYASIKSTLTPKDLAMLWMVRLLYDTSSWLYAMIRISRT